jgi:hypothetical protein
MTLRGIRNVNWHTYEEPHDIMIHVIADFRDKDGHLWRAGYPLSKEVVFAPEEVGVLRTMLRLCWSEFKRTLEGRYQEVMDYEHPRKPRMLKWYREHDGAYARFHGWDLEEDLDTD